MSNFDYVFAADGKLTLDLSCKDPYMFVHDQSRSFASEEEAVQALNQPDCVVHTEGVELVQERIFLYFATFNIEKKYDGKWYSVGRLYPRQLKHGYSVVIDCKAGDEVRVTDPKIEVVRVCFSC